MEVLWILLVAVPFLIVADPSSDWTDLAKQAVDKAAKENAALKLQLYAMTRQMMLQQFFVEEQTRSNGDSGLKQIRIHRTGRKNYYAEHHAGGSVAAIHDHSNNIRTVGMGEIVVVLNGVEFRTRHNDYRLYQPSSSSQEYHKLEDIEFPKVPPEVNNKPTLAEKIQEMREWFKAWRDQNDTVRDYKKYFQPILCYLEGAWTTKTGETIDEPFFSDRHFVDAKSWFELQERFRFTSYTGTKHRNENLPFLPTTIFGFVNDTVPLLAQWNYRILCHKLKQHVPTSKFLLQDDLSTRMRYKTTIHRHLHSRAARFTLNHNDQDRPSTHTFLDKLMEEIPGKDNYPGNLEDGGLEGQDTVLNVDDSKKKNVAYYHRWYKLAKKDAMGLQLIHRSFSDDYMYGAMTTQKRIPGMTVVNPRKCTGWGKNRVCEKISQKWTYAIPLEIIYLTPLNEWNPYNLEYKGNYKWNDAKSASVYHGPKGKWTRYGDCQDQDKAYNGTNSKVYYRTPVEFFTGNEKNRDPADTSRYGGACVLKKGELKKVMASGTRIFFPNIPGVGVLRQRWPIMPVHGEGSGVWKELNAIKDMMMNLEKYKTMMGGETGSGAGADKQLDMSTSTKIVTAHTHRITLTPNEVSQLKGGRELTITTSQGAGHQHTLKVKYDLNRDKFYYKKCDTKSDWQLCWDGHPRDFIVVA